MGKSVHLFLAGAALLLTPGTASAEVDSNSITTAAEMADCRDLPMGPHDMEAAASRQADAFASFVHRERELVDLLRARVVRDEAIVVGEDTGPA